MISAIILSAGESRRFGSPKALVPLKENMPAVNFLISNLLEIEDLEIIVVLGAHAERIQPVILKHTNARVVYNKDHNFGQTSSVQMGVKNASSGSCGFMLLPVDCPFIKSSTIIEMISKFRQDGPDLLIPSCNGRKGHPPIFAGKCREEILGLDVNRGLNAYQKSLAGNTQIFETDDSGVLWTFNTPEELADVKRKAGLI